MLCSALILFAAYEMWLAVYVHVIDPIAMVTGVLSGDFGTRRHPSHNVVLR